MANMRYCPIHQVELPAAEWSAHIRDIALHPKNCKIHPDAGPFDNWMDFNHHYGDQTLHPRKGRKGSAPDPQPSSQAAPQPSPHAPAASAGSAARPAGPEDAGDTEDAEKEAQVEGDAGKRPLGRPPKARSVVQGAVTEEEGLAITLSVEVDEGTLFRFRWAQERFPQRYKGGTFKQKFSRFINDCVEGFFEVYGLSPAMLVTSAADGDETDGDDANVTVLSSSTSALSARDREILEQLQGEEPDEPDGGDVDPDYPDEQEDDDDVEDPGPSREPVKARDATRRI